MSYKEREKQLARWMLLKKYAMEEIKKGKSSSRGVSILNAVKVTQINGLEAVVMPRNYVQLW